jgi:hypothetical protein
MEAKLLSGRHAMITPKTKAYLETESVKATMAGAPFALDTLIQLAHTYEKNYNKVPTMNLTCGTNSVELRQNITQQSSIISYLKKENARAAEVNWTTSCTWPQLHSKEISQKKRDQYQTS